MRLFSERVRDCEIQLWSSELYVMPKLKLHCKYKEAREEELYIIIYTNIIKSIFSSL